MARRYYTTGEAADICGVSRSTIVRRYDAGEFQGPQNIVTSERRVSRESLIAFMEKNGIPPARLMSRERTVLLVSASPDDAALVADALATAPCETAVADDWLGLAEKLNHAAPGVMLLDAGFPEIPAGRILQALKGRESLRDIKVILIRTADDDSAPVAHPRVVRTLKRPLSTHVVRSAVLAALGPEEQASVISREERRACPRVTMDEEVEFAVVLKTGERYGKGHGRMRDLSEGGACLSHLHLGEKPLPAEPFELKLERAGATRLDELTGHLDPVRVTFDDGFTLGGRFGELGDEDRELIRRLATEALGH